MPVPSVQLTATNYLQSRGISKEAAVALVSVLYAESGLNPGSQGTQSTETPGVLNPSGAYGIASWNGPRQEDLAKHAKMWNVPVDSLETQLHFVLTEMANHYKPSWEAMNSTGTYESIIEVLVPNYESPKDVPAEVARAKQIAAPLHIVVPETVPVVLKPMAPKPATPTTQLPTGVETVPPIDPVLITTLVQLFAPIAESLLAGLVKGIIQQLATMQAKQAPVQLPIPLASLPGFDPAALAKLIAAELSAIQGVKL
jgi:hypothetical protein